MTREIRNGLQVDAKLANFIETQALPGTGVSVDAFWASLSELIHDFGPRNAALLAKRDEIQSKIDAWHVANRGTNIDDAAYRDFLTEIGYLLPEGEAFESQNPARDFAPVLSTAGSADRVAAACEAAAEAQASWAARLRRPSSLSTFTATGAPRRPRRP